MSLYLRQAYAPIHWASTVFGFSTLSFNKLKQNSFKICYSSVLFVFYSLWLFLVLINKAEDSWNPDNVLNFMLTLFVWYLNMTIMKASVWNCQYFVRSFRHIETSEQLIGELRVKRGRLVFIFVYALWTLAVCCVYGRSDFKTLGREFMVPRYYQSVMCALVALSIIFLLSVHIDYMRTIYQLMSDIQTFKAKQFCCPSEDFPLMTSKYFKTILDARREIMKSFSYLMKHYSPFLHLYIAGLPLSASTRLHGFFYTYKFKVRHLIIFSHYFASILIVLNLMEQFRKVFRSQVPLLCALVLDSEMRSIHREIRREIVKSNHLTRTRCQFIDFNPSVILLLVEISVLFILSTH